MGGLGSGNRWNHRSRAICEQMKRIDIRFMRRSGWLTPGRSGSLSWSIGDEPMGDISYRVHRASLELIYKVREGDEDWRDVNEYVPFSFTAQRLGGKRCWFLCPRCQWRCAVLYGGSFFRCRRCYRLGYQSQHEPSAMWRALGQAQKLRPKYGGSRSIDEPFPEKPKGMHWRTYEQLCRRADLLEGRISVLETDFYANLIGRLGVGSLSR